MRKKLEKIGRKRDFEIIEFNLQEDIYIIKVKHFTKYSIFSDDKDDDDEDDKSEKKSQQQLQNEQFKEEQQ